MLTRKPPPRREPRQSDYLPDMRPAAAVMRPVGQAVARVMPAQKTPDRVQQSIRDSARGEECTVRIEGVCNFNPATTVWSHGPFNDAGKGMGIKGLDVIGCYACSACHDVVDGRATRPAGMTREQVLLDWFFGMARSLVRLRQKGIL